MVTKQFLLKWSGPKRYKSEEKKINRQFFSALNVCGDPLGSQTDFLLDDPNVTFFNDQQFDKEKKNKNLRWRWEIVSAQMPLPYSFCFISVRNVLSYRNSNLTKSEICQRKL